MGKKGKRKAQQGHSRPCCSEACDHHAVMDSEVLTTCQRIFESELFNNNFYLRLSLHQDGFKFLRNTFDINDKYYVSL